MADQRIVLNPLAREIRRNVGERRPSFNNAEQRSQERSREKSQSPTAARVRPLSPSKMKQRCKSSSGHSNQENSSEQSRNSNHGRSHQEAYFQRRDNRDFYHRTGKSQEFREGSNSTGNKKRPRAGRWVYSRRKTAMARAAAKDARRYTTVAKLISKVSNYL